tara:strand:+ start:145 stop:354 length:210 start_codon:yes stop_codon:yes gene_type:complete
MCLTSDHIFSDIPPQLKRELNMATKRNPEKKLVAAFIEVKTKKKLEALAKKRGVTVSDLLRRQIKKLVG